MTGAALVAAAMLVAGTAWAADDSMEDLDALLEDEAPPPAQAAAEAAAGPTASDAVDGDGDAAAAPARRPMELPTIGEDQLAVFVLQRGFYFSSDLGVFTTLGGTRGYSKLQPYVSVKAGYDVNDLLSLQVALSAGYAAGNPVSAADDPSQTVGGRGIANYGLISAGGEAVVAWRPAERLAVEPKVGAGLTRLVPSLSQPDDPNAAMDGQALHVVAGVDVKYLTLLTDFSAGVTANTYYIVGPDILALAGGFVVRYTF